MMIKKFATLFLMIVFSATAAVEASTFAEVKAGYFYSTDSVFRKIYSNGGGIYGVELNHDLWFGECCGLQFWASANYFSKLGFSIGDKDKTRVTFIPLGGGLKYVISYNCLDFYLGAGVLGTYFQTANKAPFMLDRVSKWGVGGIGKLGALWFVWDSLFIDFFADYSYMKISFKKTFKGALVRKNADLSGISVGGGIGFCF